MDAVVKRKNLNILTELHSFIILQIWSKYLKMMDINRIPITAL